MRKMLDNLFGVSLMLSFFENTRNGKNIQESPSISTAMKITQDGKQRAEEKSGTKAQTSDVDFLRTKLVGTTENFFTQAAQEKGQLWYTYKLQCLLNATLNADLGTVTWILNETKQEQRCILLSAVGRATITHLNIERTGTPLQMALYGHDEEMVTLFYRHMNPAEFQRQWEAVFGPDYNKFLARQQQDANDLCGKLCKLNEREFNVCGELDSAFKAASNTDVTNALNHIANTTSALQDTLNRFKSNVERYVRENQVHNPYILQRLFEFFYSPTFDNWNKGCLLSQQAIGLAQKLSSPRWLQHFSQALHDYFRRNKEPALRSFRLQGSQSAVDIRSLLDRLGVDVSIDLYGHHSEFPATSSLQKHVLLHILQNCLEQKNRALPEHYAASRAQSRDESGERSFVVPRW